MRIKLICVGSASSALLEQQLCNEYIKRITAKLEIKEVPQSRTSVLEKRKAEEGAHIQKHLKAGDYKILMDKSGKQMSSEAFADMLITQADSGVTIAFIIGGSDGLDETLLKSANLKIAFGHNTWPHMFCRAMLLEQIYRAQCISKSHPYHK